MENSNFEDMFFNGYDLWDDEISQPSEADLEEYREY